MLSKELKLKKPGKLSKSDKEFFEIVRRLAYLKDMRDVYRRISLMQIFPLYQEIGKRFGLSVKEVTYLSSEEIINGLINGLKSSKDLIEKRMNGFLMYYKNEKLEIILDSEEIKQKIDLINEKMPDIIKGIVASKGNVKGQVKIVLCVFDLSKVNFGDVLVSITTHPDFVLAMQKASAFVTDEGGLTSHAAIIARELKKPCIVGTKIATKVLKDGDYVQVDAINGIVTKIKQ